jgi:geranylgeranyl reductase family protein
MFEDEAVSSRYDVAVVGGGPAGAATGLHLARQGVRVGIFEKERLPRYKPCGGGVTARALEILPPEAAAAVERTCGRVWLDLGPERLRFAVQRPERLVGMVMRDRFDAALLAAAREAGAEIHPACKVTGLRSQDGTLRLETSRGCVACAFAVAADGALGRTAGLAGWPETRRLALALEVELAAGGGNPHGSVDTVRFDFGCVPGGYAWTFPKRDHLSVGVGVFRRRRGAARLPQNLQRYLIRCGLEGAREIRRQGGSIPVSPRRDGFVRNRVLLAGDAAGLADPLTGEGIYSGLRSGYLAAEALVAGDLEEPAVREVYEARLRKHLLGELALGRGLAGFFYGWPRLRNGLFSLCGQPLFEAVSLVVLGRKGYGELLGDPGNYLRLLKRRELPKAAL